MTTVENPGFKSKELSLLYEKLNETKKKLESSKLALKASKTSFQEQPSNREKSPKMPFFNSKTVEFLEDNRSLEKTLGKSSFLGDESMKKSHERFYERSKEKAFQSQELQRRIDEEIRRNAECAKVSMTSYRILVEKLKKTLVFLLESLKKKEKNNVTFEELGRLFFQLDFFKILQYDEEMVQSGNSEDFSDKQFKRRMEEMVFHEQFWKVISGGGVKNAVDIELIYSMLRILMDPVKLTVDATADLISQYLDKFIISDKSETGKAWSVEELVKNFKKLVMNNLAYMKTGYLKPKKFEEIQEKLNAFPFQPKINPTSLFLESQNTIKFLQKHPLDEENNDKSSSNNNQENSGDNKRNTSMGQENLGNLLNVNKSIEMRSEFISPKDRYKLLYKKQKILEEELNKKRELKQAEIEKECTFVPNGRKTKVKEAELVNRLYTVVPVFEKDEISLRNREEKEKRELDQCTFQPNINKEIPKPKPTPSEDLPKDYKKTIRRLRTGYSSTQKRKQALEKISLGENLDRLKKENVKPFSFLTDEAKHTKSKPFVYIDVNVGPGRTGRIGLHENDDPQKVAYNFTRAFQLNPEMQSSLEELLIGQLESFNKTQQDKKPESVVINE